MKRLVLGVFKTGLHSLSLGCDGTKACCDVGVRANSSNTLGCLASGVLVSV